LKRSETLYEALKAAQWPKSEREMVLVFHQNGRSTVSARLIAPGSRLVGFGPSLWTWRRGAAIGRFLAALRQGRAGLLHPATVPHAGPQQALL